MISNNFSKNPVSGTGMEERGRPVWMGTWSEGTVSSSWGSWEEEGGRKWQKTSQVWGAIWPSRYRNLRDTQGDFTETHHSQSLSNQRESWKRKRKKSHHRWVKPEKALKKFIRRNMQARGGWDGTKCCRRKLIQEHRTRQSHHVETKQETKPLPHKQWHREFITTVPAQQEMLRELFRLQQKAAN